MSQLGEHLAFLYGNAQAAEIEPRLQQLLCQYGWKGLLPPPLTLPDPPLLRLPHETRFVGTPRLGGDPGRGREELPLSQADAILITYGDQVKREGEAPIRTLVDFLSRHAAELISFVHLLPFYPYSSDDGYSIIDYLTVNPELGGWEDVEALGRHFRLIFDFVLNHCSAESQWFQRFLAGDPEYQNWFIEVAGNPDLSQVFRPRALPLLTQFDSVRGPIKVWTTFSSDQVDLNLANPEVMLVLVEILLRYVLRGAEALRLDAANYLWKEIGTSCSSLPQTHSFIQLLRSILDLLAPQVALITETNIPHRENVSYFGDGYNEAQLVYNFALPPLVLHSISTNSAEILSGWAETLELPSPRTTFFNFLASHDGIGISPVQSILSSEQINALIEQTHRHGGLASYKNLPDGSKTPYELNINYFDALSDPAGNEPLSLQIDRFLLAIAIQLALRGVPGIYFHSLFGSRSDRKGVEESGIPRLINRQKLSLAELEAELAVPNSLRSQVLAGFHRLIALRRSSSAFHPAGEQRVLIIDPRVFALLRISPDGCERALCLHNVSDQKVRLRLEGEAARLAGTFVELSAYKSRWKLGL